MAHQTSIHTPQRIEGESFSDYKERRALSHKLARSVTVIKSGAETSREALRNAQRAGGRMKRIAGSFGRGLMNAITRRQRAALDQKSANRMADVR